MNMSSQQQAVTVEKLPIFGVPFSTMNMQNTVRYLTEAIERREANHVITANPIMVMAAVNDPQMLQIMQRADLVVPDGAGIVWAANYVNRPLPERVTGFDLLHHLMKLGDEREWRVFLLGTSQEIITEAARRLALQYPNVQIVGVRNGFFGEDEDHEVVSQIQEAAPDILFVARSAATQEPWIAKYRNELNVPVMMGVGGSFDVISGKLKRAPRLFQKMRLEWFYRLMKEPWRFKRMLALPEFMWKVIREKENVTKP